MRPMFRFDVYTERHEGLKYEGSTTAVSEAKAINNVRYNTRGLYESQYEGWPWSAINKGPATEEDRQMDMINQAQGQKRDKLHTFIEVDIDRLEEAAKRRGKKLKDVNKWMERGNSYCSQRRKYGTLSEWDIELIEANGIPRDEFQPVTREYETTDIMNGGEKIAEIQTVKEPDDTEIKVETVEGGYFTINSEGMRMSFATEDRPTTIKKIMGDSSSILIGYCMFIQEDPEDVIRKIVNAHLDSILFGLINKEGGDGHDIP